MGRPKHHLELGDETMLMRVLRLVRAVCGRVAVVGSQQGLQRSVSPEIPLFKDVLPKCGPLGGIYTGLCFTRTEYNLFLGCDLPLMPARFLRFLSARAIKSGADVTVPLCGPGNYQPLCAIYRRRVRAVIRSRIARSGYKVAGMFARVRCEVVGARDIAGLGFGQRIFTNVNTPGEYEALVRDLGVGLME